jgi:hypothetical protein
MLRKFESYLDKYFVGIYDGLTKRSYFVQVDAYSDIMRTGEQTILNDIAIVYRYVCNQSGSRSN